MSHQRVSNLVGALATTLSDRLIQAMARESGLSSAGVAAITVLDARPEQSIETLRSALDLSHSATVRLVRQLEGKKLVARKDGQDRRVVLIRLTALGRRAAARMSKARLDTCSDALSSLTADEIKLLESVLDALLLHLTNSEKEAIHLCRFCDERACPQETCPSNLGWRREERNA